MLIIIIKCNISRFLVKNGYKTRRQYAAHRRLRQPYGTCAVVREHEVLDTWALHDISATTSNDPNRATANVISVNFILMFSKSHTYLVCSRFSLDRMKQIDFRKFIYTS